MAKNRRRVNSDEDKFLSEPLDVLNISVVGRDGQKKVVPALNVGFMEPRGYVMYTALPHLFLPGTNNINQADIEEWLERTSYFEGDLTWLLKLPHHRFWSQVVYDEDLQACLQSYLSNAPRDYDLNQDAQEDVLSRECHIHKLVFLIFLRMSTYKESKMHHISPKAFGEIIYDNYLFDIPRMMDICALYWFRNQSIVSKMMQNLFVQQPAYFVDLEQAVPCLLMAFDSIEERLDLKDNSNSKTPSKLDESNSSSLSSFHTLELLDVINYLTDVSATLFAFTEAYSLSGSIFFKSHANTRIPSFYDLVFPLLEMEIAYRRDSSEYGNCLDVMASKIVLSKSFLVRFFRNLITTVCIQPVLESKCDADTSTEDSESFQVDDYLQTFMEISTEKVFLQHYNSVFPFDCDIEVFSDAAIPIDSASLKYVLSCVESSEPQSQNNTASHNQANGPFDDGLGKSVRPKDRLLKKAGNRSNQGSPNGCSGEQGASTFDAVAGATALCSRPDEVGLMSLIQTVKDVMPDLADGFIEMCLDYYNYNHEQVIDAVLSDRLPPHLQNMDRNLQRKKPVDQQPQNASVSLLSERKSIFDYDEFDVFNRDNVPLERIRKGKINKTPTSYNALIDESASSALKDLILSYEAQSEEKDDSNLYEDEYDDTYDSHGVNIIEPQPETELNRPFTTPIVLRSLKKGNRQQAQEEAGEDNGSDDEGKQSTENKVPGNEEPEAPRKNGLDFCENPEVIRQRAEERRQSKMARGKPSNSQKTMTFHNKERHKSHVANHSRRKQADYKASRGMGGLPSR